MTYAWNDFLPLAFYIISKSGQPRMSNLSGATLRWR
jgi:hypothetical protein